MFSKFFFILYILYKMLHFWYNVNIKFNKISNSKWQSSFCLRICEPCTIANHYTAFPLKNVGKFFFSADSNYFLWEILRASSRRKAEYFILEKLGSRSSLPRAAASFIVRILFVVSRTEFYLYRNKIKTKQ